MSAGELSFFGRVVTAGSDASQKVSRRVVPDLNARVRTLLGHALRASFFSRTENAAASRGCIAVQPSATATRTIRSFYRHHQTPMRQTHVWPGPLVTKHLASYCADESGGPKTGRRARAC